MRRLPLVLLVACGSPHFTTESGRLDVQADGFVDLSTGDAANPVLAGSSFAPTIGVAGSEPSDVGACFEDTFEGPIAGDRTRLTFTGAGTAVWTLTAVPCTVSDTGFVPEDDQLVVEVVDAADVEGRLAATTEALAEEMAAEGTLRLDAPDGWVPAPGEPWRALGDRDVHVSPRVVTADGRPVAWQSEGAATTASTGIDTPTMEGSEASFFALAGDEVDVTLHVGDAAIPAGTVLAVEASEVKDLEIAVAYLASPEGEVPYAARAVAWDADGHPIFGVPVEWSVRGDLVVAPFSADMPDYALVGDQCVPPSENVGERTATLKARWKGRSATKALAWVARSTPGDDTEFVPHEDCPGPCGCGTASLPGAAVPGLLAAVALARRRGPTTPRAPRRP